MRHHPSCWNKVLAKLGFRRVTRRYKHQAAFAGRMSRIEPLESRQMMTVTVNTLADVVDSGDAYISLREALLDSDPQVAFDASLSGGRIVLSQGQLNINKAVTITGPGADQLTIDAADMSRVFAVNSASATISGLKITGGKLTSASEHGGGILNTGTLTLNNVEVVGNTATGVGGGVASLNTSALANSLFINDSTIRDNHAVEGSGVAAYPDGGSFQIRRSTISNNTSQIPLVLEQWSAGGGIQLVGAVSSPLIENSTISGNVSTFIGGIRLWGVTSSLQIVNSTIAFNRSLIAGAGIDVPANSVAPTVHSSIIAQNTNGFTTPVHADVNGNLNASSTYSLFGSGAGGLTLTGAGNKIGTPAAPWDPKLSPLDNYGGRNKTHAPLPGSPALDAGGPAIDAPATDQRGFSRLVDRAEPNVTSVRDMGAVELSVSLSAAGDFNGDGREDRVLFDPITRSLQVAAGSAAGGGHEVAAWGIAPNEVTALSTFVVGDFNGDNRDDLLITTAGVYRLAISDGSTFLIQSVALPASWNVVYASDFDGDGSDEILGGTQSGGNYTWSVADYRDAFGLSAPIAAPSLNGFSPAFQQFFQDVNRDGRKDIITRTGGSSPWMVRLAGVGADSALTFAAAADWNAWVGYGYNASTGKLDADKAMAKVIEEFAWIYNNVELELYPGLMKGPEATRQTKAGNNWDQAALLEKRLQALGLGDVKIASGKARVTEDQFGNLANWLGVLPTSTPSMLYALYNVLKSSLDANAVAFDANGNSTTDPSVMTAIEFTHAWVQAYVPTATGLAWINLDPSWKLKDRQAGVPLASNLELDNVHTLLSTGIFDEYSYLALNPTNDRRLPIEFFEDQVLDWLAKTPAHQGNSLAEVAHDGPIRSKSFATLPTGFMDGLTLAANPGVVTYNDFATIASNATLKAELTHRVSIRLLNGTTEHWSQDLVVPESSLDTIHVTFASSLADVSDPNKIAAAGSATLFGRLVVGGVLKQAAQSGESFSASGTATIEVLHFAPTRVTGATSLSPGDADYVGPSEYDQRVRFSEKPGDIVSIGLEANQYSNESLAAMQASLLAAVAGDTTEAQLLEDVDLLGSYAIAKYWYDYQRQNDAIAGLMGTVSTQSWVGSGRIKSKPNLLEDPTGPAGDVFIDYLAFGMAPEGFGIDLPNTNNGAISIANGAFHTEAWQLMGYNSSALEHNIVEEITSAESVSTIKGLQRAYQRNLGLNSSGGAVSNDLFYVFVSDVSGSTRTLIRQYDVSSSGDVTTINSANLNSSQFKSLLSHHDAATNLDDKLWNFFQGLTPADGKVTVLVPKYRTDVDNWTGAVYIADIPGGVGATVRSTSFSIVADGGSTSNGGYSGGVTKAPPPELKPGTFVNASWAGDPVHVANGNMFRDETDIVFPNIGVPLTFSRHYDSQSKDEVGMGVGWTYSFSDMLYLDEKGTAGTTDDEVVWAAASGARHRFKKLADGTFTTPYGLQGKLTRIATNEYVTGGYKYVYLDPSGMEYHFQELNDAHPNNGFDGPHKSVGRLRMQCDEDGNGVLIDYTHPTIGHGFTQIRDIHNANRRLVFSYGAVDRVVSIVKYDGSATPVATWNYAYTDVTGVTDSTKRLISVTTPAVAAVDGTYQESTASTTVQYDYYNVATGDPAYAKGLIKRITEADGAWHAYEYYRNGRVFRVKQSEAFTSTAGWSGSFANTSDFVGLRNTSAPNNYTAGATSIGGTLDARRSSSENFAYLADTALAVPGGVLSATTPGGFEAFGTLTFDASTNDISLIWPELYIGFFGRNNTPAGGFGFKVGNNSTTAFNFFATAGTAATGVGTAVTQGTYKFEIDVNNVDSGSGKVRLRLLTTSSTVAADVSVDIPPGLALQADSFGILQPLSDWGMDWTFGFNLSDINYTGETPTNPTQPLEPSGTPVGDVQTFNYNLVRNLTEFTDERGNVETYIHQKNGLLTKQIHADRSHTKSTWGAIDTSEEFLMTSTTDERGAVETFAYYTTADFKKGRLRESTAKSFPNQTALLTRYDYVQPNATNKPHLIASSTAIVDPDSVVVDGDYYVGQKLTTTRQYYGSGDAVGKLWKTTDAQGNVTEYSYYLNSDSAVYRRGLLKAIRQPAIVDVEGNPVQYETLFDYDAAGNVTSTTTQNVATTPVVVAQETFVYDTLGNVVQRIVGANVVAERAVTESVYDALGRLRDSGFADANAAIDPLDGFSSRFKYDKSGRVREAIDPLGRVTRFEYDRQGNVVKQFNPDGTQLSHEYDPFGNRIATTDPLGRITRFVYDSRNRMVQTIYADGAIQRLRYDGAGNVVAKIDAFGNATTFKYDAAGRLLETKLPDPDGPLNDDGGNNLGEPTTTNKYDKLGNLIETIDPEANVAQFKYDKLGRVVQSQTLKGVNGDRNVATPWVVTGTLQSLTTTDYDAVGNVIETAVYDVSQYDAVATATLLANPRAEQTPANVTANKVQIVSSRYDALGRVLKTFNADNTTTSATYDAVGRVRFQYDALNRVTEYRYDALGRLEKTLLPDPNGGDISTASPTTTYRYDAAGNRIATIDPRGFTTQFEYDAYNRLIATVDPQGNRTRSVYDVAGQLVATVDALSRANYTLYDKRGRAIELRAADPDGAGPNPAPVTRHRYDAAGRVIETIDPLGYSTSYQYDRLGRLVKETFTTGYMILDADDPGFHIQSGSAAPRTEAGDYGGDSLLVTPSPLVHGTTNVVMYWRLNNVDPGSYRVLAHWGGAAENTSTLYYRISDYYNPGVSSGTFFNLSTNDIDTSYAGSQKVSSRGQSRSEGGAWRDWQELTSNFAVESGGPGSLGVQFIAYNQAIRADAIRIERIASRSYQYDHNGNLVKEIDPLGRETTYAYDELDRVVTETLPDPDGVNYLQDGVVINPLLSPQTTTAYDGYGNVSSIVERRGNGGNIRKTTYDYDARNRRTEEIVDADNGNVNVTYLNRKTTFSYDLVGNLATKIELPDHPTLARKTSYYYDHLDRLYVYIQNDVGGFITTSVDERMEVYYYDKAGNITKTLVNPITDQRQVATLNLYDSLGQLVERTEQGLVNGVTEKRITRFEYDAAGNEIATIDPLLRLSRSEYDRLGRLVKSTDPDPDGAGPLAPHTTTSVYDAAGNLLSQTNGAGETEKFAYDPQGRLIRSEDGRGDVTTRRYDVAGNLVKLTDPAGNATEYTYDALDRKRTETTTAGVRQFIYDGNGNLSITVSRNGEAFVQSYDRLDQPGRSWEYTSLAQAQTPGSQSFIAFTDRFYDELGRVIEQRHTRRVLPQQGQIEYRATDSYKYDGLDRVIERSNQSLLTTTEHSVNIGNVLLPAVKQTYVYAYDANSFTTTREQFVAGQFAAATKSSYNVFGELARQEDKDASAASVDSTILDFDSTDAVFTYLGDGSLASTTRYTDWDASLPGGAGHRNRVQTNYTYDGAGRIKNIAHAQTRRSSAAWSANTPLATFSYKHDAANRISEITTDWNTGQTGLTTRTDTTQAYEYDDAGQLTSGGYEVFAYGTNGNRIAAWEGGVGVNEYETGADNQVDQDTYWSYQYDAEGNLIRRDGITHDNYDLYFWDHRNRLIKIERRDAGGLLETIAYRYNTSGELIYRSITPAGQSAQTEHYLVDGGQRTMAFEIDGDVKRRYQYGPTGDVLFEQVFNATGNPTLQAEQDLVVPLGDHQHTTWLALAHAVDDAAYVRQSYDVSSFGRNLDTFGADGLPDYAGRVATHGFQGMVYDVQAGHYRTDARVYDPHLGRFISIDPIHDGSNWYMFAGNNPVNYADPLGLSLQGYPLGGGYSGNVTRKPTIGQGNIPANALSTVGTPLGYALKRSTTSTTPTAQPFSYTLGSSVGPYSYGINVAPFLAQPQLSPEARLETAKQLAGQWYVADSSRRAAQSQINELPAQIALLEKRVRSPWANVGRSNNIQPTLNKLSDVKSQLAYAKANLPKYEAAGYALASEYSDRGFDSINYTTWTPGEQLVGGTGIRNVAYAVTYGGPVSGLGYSPSPIDFVTGGLSAGLNSGFRAGVGAFVQDFATEATGLPFLPSLRTSLGSARKTAMAADVELHPYSNRGAFTTPGQAHHLNQDAAFRSQIAHSQGVTVKLEGNAFTGVGTPHYVAHESMESFWDIYRRGGMDAGNLPTNSQYNRALYNGLQESGLSPTQALRAVEAAKAQQLRAGLRGSDLVPRLPGRINQAPGGN